MNSHWAPADFSEKIDIKFPPWTSILEIVKNITK